MASIRRARAKKLVLDIGSSAIRLCELSQTKAGYQLTKYFQRELDIDPSWSEEEKTERAQERLAELLKEAKVRTRRTIVAVPGQSVFTRIRPLPPVPEYKVSQIVRYEIQQQIPFSLDQIALDYQILDRTEVGGYEVMMAAIKVDVVEKQLEILKKTRRSIETVDVCPISAYNWLLHSGEFGEDGQCVALIDMGAATTDIVIHKDNQFRFTRSLHIGGNDISSAIATAFNMSFEDAEKLKRERGFAPTGDAKRDGKGGEVIGRVTGRLVSEINRSLGYYRSQPGGAPVSRIILTGGGACLRNIVPYLQRMLNIEVRIAQPLAGLVVGPGAKEASENPEQASVALGLALRSRESVSIEINLIPRTVIESARRRQQAFYWALSMVTLFLIMASIVPVTLQKTKLEEDRIARLKNVLVAYDPSLQAEPTSRSPFEDEMMIADSDVQSYIDDVTFLDDLRSNRLFWLDYIREINDAMPIGRGIAISSIETAVFGGPGNTGEEARKLRADATKKAQAPSPNATTNKLKYAESSAISAFARISPPSGRSRLGFARETDGLIEPNGFIIYGYAASIATLRDFVDRLKETDVFIEGGIYFYQDFVDVVEGSELTTARIAGGGATQIAGALGGPGGGGTGGFKINIAAIASSVGSFSGLNEVRIADDIGEIFLFHIDLQFAGNPLDLGLEEL